MSKFHTILSLFVFVNRVTCINIVLFQQNISKVQVIQENYQIEECNLDSESKKWTSLDPIVKDAKVSRFSACQINFAKSLHASSNSNVYTYFVGGGMGKGGQPVKDCWFWNDTVCDDEKQPQGWTSIVPLSYPRSEATAVSLGFNKVSKITFTSKIFNILL